MVQIIRQNIRVSKSIIRNFQLLKSYKLQFFNSLIQYYQFLMGNFNSQQQHKQKIEQILSYQEYLDRRPKNNASSQISTYSQKFKEKIQIIHQVHYLKRSDKIKIEQYLSMLEEVHSENDCQGLYLPVLYKIEQSQSYCYQQRRIQMFFEYYQVKLCEQIKSRRIDKDFFSEEQIWYILYSLVKACKKFEKYNIGSGVLNSSMILLNKKGHLKLINRLTNPQHFFIELGKEYENLYSPQQLKNIREKSKKRFNPNVCQTFSIGIILLEVCSLIDANSFYDPKRMCVIENMLNKIINFIDSKYSKLLISLIKTMTSFNYQNRPLPSQIYETFRPYQKKILFLKPFKFNVSQVKNIPKS